MGVNCEVAAAATRGAAIYNAARQHVHFREKEKRGKRTERYEGELRGGGGREEAQAADRLRLVLQLQLHAAQGLKGGSGRGGARFRARGRAEAGEEAPAAGRLGLVLQPQLHAAGSKGER